MPELTLAALRKAWAALQPKAWNVTLVCHPADEQAAHALLDLLPEADGKVRLKTNRFLDAGTMILIDDERIDAMVRAPFESDLARDAQPQAPADKSDEEFLDHLRRLGEDWRVSDEAIGIAVRNRYARKYDTDSQDKRTS